VNGKLTIEAMTANRARSAFYVQWNIGKRCNYDCAYCPGGLHDSTSSHHSLEVMRGFADQLHRQIQRPTIQIWFTGGEPTVNPHFLLLCRYISETYGARFRLGLTTNGSRTERYYLELLEYVTYLQFSTHFEFVRDPQRYQAMIARCASKAQAKGGQCHVSVNLMMEPERWEAALAFERFLKSCGIRHYLKRIRGTGDRADGVRYDPPYSAEQLAYLEDTGKEMALWT
jgi:sulfatase maturation enzyme AslB (radical SAM superfamily)